jgi:hypothetical protein
MRHSTLAETPEFYQHSRYLAGPQVRELSAESSLY